MLISAADITAALRAVGVAEDDTIFVHAGLQGSGRVEGARSRDKLATITAGLAGAVEGGTLILPTFTYSHCWDEVYDLAETPSTVGLLSEHFRRLPGVRRTADPIFSAAVLGPVDAAFEEPLFAVGDSDCFGPRSIFAQLAARNGTVVFYDVGFGFCTFVHHVEQALAVPYRYPKAFTGTVRDGDVERETATTFYVRHLDQDADPHFGPLEAALAAEGALRRTTIPGGPTLLAVDTRAIAAVVRREVAANPDFLIPRGHPVAVAA